MADIVGMKKALSVLEQLPGKLKKAQEKAVLQEAQFLRAKVIEGIDSGAPGGKPFAPHSPMTLAVRKARGFGGSKILVVRGGLRGSVVAISLGPGAAFVGVHSKSGAGVNIARIHEEGRTFTTTWTARQRRWFFVMMRKAGVPPRYGPKLPPAMRKARAAAGPTAITIRIPARPFIGPVLEKYATPDQLKARFTASVAATLGDLSK